jgi:hypothetical protein
MDPNGGFDTPLGAHLYNLFHGGNGIVSKDAGGQWNVGYITGKSFDASTSSMLVNTEFVYGFKGNMFDNGNIAFSGINIQNSIRPPDPVFSPDPMENALVKKQIESLVNDAYKYASDNRPKATGAIYMTAGVEDMLPWTAVGKLIGKAGGKIGIKTTVIGRMDDLLKYADDVSIDTWHKSGILGQRVTWAQNRAWLDARIARGDAFGIATDISKLPSVKNGYIPGVPNGYFTAREFDYLMGRGIRVTIMP